MKSSEELKVYDQNALKSMPSRLMCPQIRRFETFLSPDCKPAVGTHFTSTISDSEAGLDTT